MLGKALLFAGAPSVLPWVLLALLSAGVGGSFWFHHSGYVDGKTEVQAKWDAQKVKDAAEAARMAQERQNAVDAANTAKAERDRVYALKTAPIKVEVQSYAKSPAAVVRCVDPVGVSIGNKAIAAANAATSATR